MERLGRLNTHYANKQYPQLFNYGSQVIYRHSGLNESKFFFINLLTIACYCYRSFICS
jgi:hypothetical protein